MLREPQPQLLKAWGVGEPRRLSPLTRGTNNLVWHAETPSGDYVLRVYGNHADTQRLTFEHAVLTQLADAGLPFAVPAPLPTVTGELYAHAAGDDGDTLATLTRLIPGEPPRRDDLAQASAAGEALAQLDSELARIGHADTTWGVSWRSDADLAHCHPLVPDPQEALTMLPVDEETRQRLLWRYTWLMERTPGLYAQLPQQLIHEDFDPANVLMVGQRVSGVLDFEFCSRDLRVMDLTVALSWWPIERFGTGAEWPIVRTLARGYRRHASLTPEEVDAIPVLFSLRAYTSLIHRLGRFRQGLSPLWAVTDRVSAALEREAWLRGNGQRLVETVGEALAY